MQKTDIVSGTIIKAVAGVFDVYCDEKIYSCFAEGKFRSKKTKLLVGDKVKIQFGQNENDKCCIIAVEPRKNSIVRPTVANIDTLLIVFAPQKPEPDLMLVDYLICWCRLENIEPAICINKSDYDTETAEKLAEQYKKSDIKVFVTSKEDPESIEKLKSEISTGLTCLCGQSAVGKSTLMNQLLEFEKFEVGGLSRKTEKGKNTTRHCEIVPFAKNKLLSDTPGFSLLELPEIDPEKIKETYYEFIPYVGDCRFTGCNHVSEPDCAVKAALESGKISIERYNRYKEILAQAQERWRKRYD